VLATPRHGRDVKWLAERKYPISPHSHTVSPSQGEAPAEPPPFSPPLKHRQQLTVQTQPQRLGRSLALPKQPNTSSQQHIPLHSFVSIRGSKHHPIRVHSWFKTPLNSCPFVVQNRPSIRGSKHHSTSRSGQQRTGSGHFHRQHFRRHRLIVQGSGGSRSIVQHRLAKSRSLCQFDVAANLRTENPRL
jgi:hypothetical protein